MAFHISVICADPAVEAALAAALAPDAITVSGIARFRPDLPDLIGDISWLTSAAAVSPRSDLAIVYDFPHTAESIDQLLPIFSHARILFLTRRSEIKMGRCQFVGPVLNYIIVPFDPEEMYLLIHTMLKTPRSAECQAD